MRRWIAKWLGVALVAALAPVGCPQRVIGDDDVKSDSPSRPIETRKETAEEQASPRERVNRSFDRNSPQIGELIPDIAGYDSAGKEFRLRNLRGQHTVLVFGCLT